MIHYELLQETCDRGHLNYLPTLHFTDSTVAQSQPREETFIIIFTNLFHQLSKPSYGRDIEIINLYLNRAPTYRLAVPRKFSHIPNSRRLYLFLFDTLKHQDDSEMSVQSNTEPCCVQNMNDDEFLQH